MGRLLTSAGRNRRVKTRNLPSITLCALTSLVVCELPGQARDLPPDPFPDPNFVSEPTTQPPAVSSSARQDNIAAPGTIEHRELSLESDDRSVAESVPISISPTSQITVAPPEELSTHPSVVHSVPISPLPASSEFSIALSPTSESLKLASSSLSESETHQNSLSEKETGDTSVIAQVSVNSMQPLFDIRGHWAEEVIQALETQGIVKGFPDNLYRPDDGLTRAQFAALLRQSFQQIPALSNSSRKPPTRFVDVPPTYWGYEAIQEVEQRQFLRGYTNQRFGPEQSITRTEVLVALVRGLKLTSNQLQLEALNTYFQDASDIPAYARGAIVAAVENRLITNYPFTRFLKPNQRTTRAEAAALLHQALVQARLIPALTPTVANTQNTPEALTPTRPGNPIPETFSPEVRPAPPEVIEDLETRLQALQSTQNFGEVFQGSPAITIANPPGFGLDDQTLFMAATFQIQTRFTTQPDGAAMIGIGVGNAREAVGLELSYTLASFGTSRGFGAGGFNAKVHRQFPEDWAVAVGWNGFLTLGGQNDFQNSVYGTVSKVIRTRDRLDLPFSRIALTAGVGSGQFRSEQDVAQKRDTVGVFGSIAIRAVEAVSLITEWTGQDLAVGLSIAPIPGVHWVITPAIRDIVGAGDQPRFVFGTGFSFKF
ncbi:MAG: S-layer homology domain-containing protein [Leptolyngbyaceae cyanobacterium bins.59]|nr:S-layer homology domain-containing protein [Leptolyngbyaceae cyanobacterium bins.59]